MANENLQLESLTDRDVRIDVLMGDITTADFERVAETVPLGEKAARGMATGWPAVVPLRSTRPGGRVSPRARTSRHASPT